MCLFFLALAAAQLPAPVDFVCPMDPDVRSKTPGKCPRCGMALVPGIREPDEYLLDLKVHPPQIPSGRKLSLEFRVRDPNTGAPVKQFEIVHEKLFHLFIVSQDLAFFAHVHPAFDGQSVFHLDTEFPRPGPYRLLADFYPKGGTPQLIPKMVTTAGYRKSFEAGIPHLTPDLTPKKAENLEVELRLDPPQPIAGKKTMMFFQLSANRAADRGQRWQKTPPGIRASAPCQEGRLLESANRAAGRGQRWQKTPPGIRASAPCQEGRLLADGLEKYLGAWAHMLAVSSDLIDTIHEHPFLADGGPQMQFNVFFPRKAMYRIWVQFQRKGVVNTVVFTVPVSQLQ